jgi:hypothetical protein
MFDIEQSRNKKGFNNNKCKLLWSYFVLFYLILKLKLKLYHLAFVLEFQKLFRYDLIGLLEQNYIKRAF